MPDVSRSDSQRSDCSQRPRVSFNRDVHVKRIGHPGTPRVVGALAGDGEGHFVPHIIRRERPTRLTRRELAKEAKHILNQADSIYCTSTSPLEYQNTKSNKRKFNTLPPIRSKNKGRKSILSKNDSPSSSLERKSKPRNLVTSVFSSLDATKLRKNKTKLNENSSKSKLDRKSSSSLSDFTQTSSEHFADFKKKKTNLSRSVSDAEKYSKTSNPLKKSSNFLSLDRLIAKQIKNRNKSQSDSSCRSQSPRQTKSLQGKSYSDSEASQNRNENILTDVGTSNKKQLSPIIESSPRENYFTLGSSLKETEKAHTSNLSKEKSALENTKNMHSSQVTYRPPLTRGKTVDLMVKRLSQDPSLNRGPPRTLNASSGLVTPGKDRQHNNNLPFSYTEPTLRGSTPTLNERDSFTPTHNALNLKGRSSSIVDLVPGASTSPTTKQEQVIYAEVVVSGGENGMLNKQTIHTHVPPVKEDRTVDLSSEKNKRNHVQLSDEDEGLGLSMDTNNRYERSSDELIQTDIHNSDRWGLHHNQDKSATGFSMQNKNSKMYKKFNGEAMKNKNSLLNQSVALDNRKNSTYTKEFSVHESKYKSGDYIFDSSGRADSVKNHTHHMLEDCDSYSEELLIPTIKNSYINDFSADKTHKVGPYLQLNGKYKNHGMKSDTKTESQFSSNDLSFRRDQLESRIESQRRERLMNSKLFQNKNFVGLGTKKYSHDGTTNNYKPLHNQPELLSSELDNDRNLLNTEFGHEHVTDYGKSFEHFSTKNSGISKMDMFADSGIETDYRKDSAGYNTFNKYDNEWINEKNKGTQNQNAGNNLHTPNTSIGDKHSGRYKIPLKSEENNISEHVKDHYIYRGNDKSYRKPQGRNDSFVSTWLVQEQRKTTEAIPSSTVLVRHYAPNGKNERNMKEERSSEDERENKDSEYSEKRNTDEYIVREGKENITQKIQDKNITNTRRMNNIKINKSATKKYVDTEANKPVKKEQISAMNKVKQLFSRSGPKSIKVNQKDGKIKGHKEREKEMEEEEEKDQLTSRYTEYRGSDIPELNQPYKLSSEVDKKQTLNGDLYSQRRQKLATPSPSSSPSPPHLKQSSATLTRIKNSKRSEVSSNNWFKSLDRLKNGKTRKKIKDIVEESTEDEIPRENEKPRNPINKNLRFFGDTDQESVTSSREKSARRYKNYNSKGNTHSSNHLQVPPSSGLRSRHRLYKSAGDVATSSAESATEGDSSQQSQKSIVYLHAATVGDIPAHAINSRAQSREELSSLVSSNHLKPKTRTVSRSISLLAPWRPKHYRGSQEVLYENDGSYVKYTPRAAEGRPPKIPMHNSNSGTLSRLTRQKNEQNKKNYGQDKQKFKSMSSESLSYRGHLSSNAKEPLSNNTQSNISASYESLTYNTGSRRERNASSKNKSSAELNSLGNNKYDAKKYGNDKKTTKLKRSASVPKDSRSTGWFKLRSKK